MTDIDLHDESIKFIDTAYDMLRCYKIDPYFTSSKPCRDLTYPFYLRMSETGKLALFSWKERSNKGNTYSGTYTMPRRISNLLGVYLELLEKELDE